VGKHLEGELSRRGIFGEEFSERNFSEGNFRKEIFVGEVLEGNFLGVSSLGRKFVDSKPRF
jgi:hypothetical protein